MSYYNSYPQEERSRITVDSLIHSEPSATQQPNTRSLPPLEELFASELLITNRVGRYRTYDRAMSQQDLHEGRRSPSSLKKEHQLPRLNLPNDILSVDRHIRKDKESPDRLQDPRSPREFQYSIADYSSVESNSSPSTPGIASSSWSSVNEDYLSEKEQPEMNHHRADSFLSRNSNRSSPAYTTSTDQTDNGLHPATYVYQPYPTDYQGVQMISGKGPCHVYSSGHCIPTHVQGQYVDPSRGLTRAKVPRRRLSTACLVCRKKKIRCEPTHDGGCLQCKKAERECKVEPSKRRTKRSS